MWESRRPQRRDDQAQRGDNEDQVDLRRLRLLRLDQPPQLVDDDGGEVVDSLPDRVEHDEAERNPDHRVHHRKQLTAVGLRGGVTVTWNNKKQCLKCIK